MPRFWGTIRVITGLSIGLVRVPTTGTRTGTVTGTIRGPITGSYRIINITIDDIVVGT